MRVARKFYLKAERMKQRKCGHFRNDLNEVEDWLGQLLNLLPVHIVLSICMGKVPKNLPKKQKTQSTLHE